MRAQPLREEVPNDDRLYGRRNGRWEETASLSLGVYDQVADTTFPALTPLPSASGLQNGTYYTLNRTGAFTTTEPNLAGKTGGAGDQIVVASGAWELVPISDDFLSAVVADTAQGVITLAAGGTTITPTSAQDIANMGYVDTGDAAVQANLDAHIAAPDPHPQYLLETRAVELFSFAAYGDMFMSSPTGFPSLGGAWQTITVFDTVFGTPRGVIVDPVSDTITVDFEGYYRLQATFLFTHNSSNQGRTTYFRIWNVTDGNQIGNDFPIGIGRNVEATAISINVPLDITPERADDALRFEIGNGSSVTSVTFTNAIVGIYAVGEWREGV